MRSSELPEEYKDLERRVDALRNAHASLLRVTKTYGQIARYMYNHTRPQITDVFASILSPESEPYDYPIQINESVTETASTISHTLTTWASAATKGIDSNS